MIEIVPRRGWGGIGIRELWQYRELIYFLVWRDVKVRYKQTILGATWAIIQPFATMVVFSVFFGKLAKIPSDGIPYPIFTYTALLPWNYFTTALSRSSSSLVGNRTLVSKVYFPRLAIPLSAVVVGLVDFLLAFLVLVGMMVYYEIVPTSEILLLPIFMLMAIGTALGLGLWLSSLHVQYRDIAHVVPFITQFWLFATPVAYPSSMLSGSWRTIYALNPMVGVVEGFRSALLGSGSVDGTMLMMSTLTVLGFLISGLIYFRTVEDGFADLI